MITAEQVRSVFAPYISDDREFGGGMIEIDTNQFVTPEGFVAAFPVESLTYDALVASDPDDRKGYRAFFDSARADGVLQNGVTST